MNFSFITCCCQENRNFRVNNKLITLTDGLNERCDIIRKLNTIFANSLFHEDNLMLELNDLYVRISGNKDNSNVLNYINLTDDLLRKALSLESVYPELSKNNDYISLKSLFKDNQYKIMYGIELYNEEAREFNDYKNGFFAKYVGKILKMKDFDYFKKKNDF